MFLTNKQADERLNSEKNLANKFGKKESSQSQAQEVKGQVITNTITEKIIQLPGKNRNNLTKDERTEIAIRTRSGEPQVDLAREKNISQYAVHAIEKGKTKGIDENAVEKVLDSVRDRALNRLMASLGLLDDDKLSGCSAKDLSVIASNMGRVFEKIQPKSERPDNINFIIYAPELKHERAYEVVEV